MDDKTYMRLINNRPSLQVATLYTQIWLEHFPTQLRLCGAKRCGVSKILLIAPWLILHPIPRATLPLGASPGLIAYAPLVLFEPQSGRRAIARPVPISRECVWLSKAKTLSAGLQVNDRIVRRRKLYKTTPFLRTKNSVITLEILITKLCIKGSCR